MQVFWVRPVVTLGTSLPTHPEIPSSIPDSTVGFFCSQELFHGTYGLNVCMSLVYILSYVVFGEGPLTLLITGPVVSMMLYVFHRKFLHYRPLACKSLVTVEVKKYLLIFMQDPIFISKLYKRKFTFFKFWCSRGWFIRGSSDISSNCLIYDGINLLYVVWDSSPFMLLSGQPMVMVNL